MSDLFKSARSITSRPPLADRMRPRTLDEFIGQEHIVGPGRLLRRAISCDRLSSIILSGPPGTGKTTLARVIANTTKSRFLSINAVLSGVQAIRASVEEATKDRELYDKKTILFVDEVHRWNKAQQDALLPYVENGTIILIGATTENPFFEVNKALVSRSRVFQFNTLKKDDLLKAAHNAIFDKERGYGNWNIVFKENSLEHLVDVSDGDARTLLNALELAIETSVDLWPPENGTEIIIDRQTAEESIQKRAVLYDRDGDYHYDAISAFIKSIRGSDPDASLYWLARMVYAGEDPKFIFRRMMISAAEDIGLADPEAIKVVESCACAFERIGMPEGQFHLAEAALYLATTHKSNSALAYFDALKAVEAESASIPNHLKDASRDAKDLGHGQGYQYPHAYKNHWTSQQYLPDAFKGAFFYQPGSIGYEASIRDEILRKRDTQLASWLSGEFDNVANSGNSAPVNHLDAQEWTNRAEAGSAKGMEGLRDCIFSITFPAKFANVIVVGADDGLILRESVRMCPEGSVLACCKNKRATVSLPSLFCDVQDLEKPTIIDVPEAENFAEEIIKVSGYNNYDLIYVYNYLSSLEEKAPVFLKNCEKNFVSEKLKIVIIEKAAVSGILPAMIKDDIAENIYNDFFEADKEFFNQNEMQKTSLASIEKSIKKAKLSIIEEHEYKTDIRRKLSKRDIDAWFADNSTYGSFIKQKIDEASYKLLFETMTKKALSATCLWPSLWNIVVSAKEQNKE